MLNNINNNFTYTALSKGLCRQRVVAMLMFWVVLVVGLFIFYEKLSIKSKNGGGVDILRKGGYCRQDAIVYVDGNNLDAS